MVFLIVFVIGVVMYVYSRKMKVGDVQEKISQSLAHMRKSGILSLVFTVFFVYYWYEKFSSFGPGVFSSFISSPILGGAFWITVVCSVIGAFTAPLISLILFLVAAFENGIPSIWGFAYLILAAINFFEWKRK